MGMITKHAKAGTMGSQSHLLALPREVRNRIVVYVSGREPTVELLSAEGPNKALMMTCRQLYSEAGFEYRSKFRAFWTESDLTMDIFAVSRRPPKNVQQQLIARLDEQSLARITKLRIAV